MIDDATFEQFKVVGKVLTDHRYNTSHSGNISMRSANKIYIKRRGAMLGYLKPSDIIETDLYHQDSGIMLSSSETDVHRQIYLETDAMAVVHAHNPFCVILSLIEDDITCLDAEGVYMYKKIPVIEVDNPAGPTDAAREVPKILKNYPIVVVRSHGAFAKGNTLYDALQNITGAEQSAMIRYYTMLIDKPLKRDYSKEKFFSEW
ncbi:MAG: fuculose phosphate aldolase [Candidatus Lokiarchaeota archaeon]|nr:fuculose phosphate aldolase [Candidatus Lokiarchaeota archaeon]MBD3342400.1 fuculose phosphate aldolase [Candidatus Lokiarchaeota archaeon]